MSSMKRWILVCVLAGASTWVGAKAHADVPPTDAGEEPRGDGGGCSASGGTSAGGLALAGLALVARRRRR